MHLILIVNVIKVCLAAVGIVSDLCRAFGTEFVPYADEIMSILIKNLGVNYYFRIIILLSILLRR